MKGVAYYEIGVHDNGELVGVTIEKCAESIIVLYHMAKSLGACIEVTKVRLGTE